MELNGHDIGLSLQTVEKIKSVFGEFHNITEVLLYGSRAKGNYHNGSDIDLSIKGDNIDFSEILTIENKLDKLLLPYKIDLNLFTAIKNTKLKEHIQRVGVNLIQH